MTIAGLGIDLVELDRLQHILNKDNREIFLKKIFSADEIKYCESYGRPVERYGARFAAKEAFIKAWGKGGLRLAEIEVIHDDHGAPAYKISTSIQEQLNSRGIHHTYLSLTHTKTAASAVAVFEQ